jgi:hypothetical protein
LDKFAGTAAAGNLPAEDAKIKSGPDYWRSALIDIKDL